MSQLEGEALETDSGDNGHFSGLGAGAVGRMVGVRGIHSRWWCNRDFVSLHYDCTYRAGIGNIKAVLTKVACKVSDETV